mgnify:CR=1 FL=1
MPGELIYRNSSTFIRGAVNYGKGQILFRDYVKTEDIFTVKMCEDVKRHARDLKRIISSKYNLIPIGFVIFKIDFIQFKH